MNELALKPDNTLFAAPEADKNMRSSINKFIAWLDAAGRHWAKCDLADYRDYLLNKSGLSDASAKKHMERVRKRYRDLLKSNAVRDAVQSQIPKGASPADVYAITQEFLTRLQNNTQYDERVAIKVVESRTFVDSDFHWLKPDEIAALFDRVLHTTSLITLRDSALIALAYSFGLRAFEAVAVTFDDLEQTRHKKRGVLIRHGKGNVRDFVLLDEATDCTHFIHQWANFAQLESGLIVRGLGKEGKSIVHEGLTTAQFENRLKLYTDARPHDLRRSYARNLYEAGRTVEYIRQQLRHVKDETTWRYIGLLG